MYSCAEEWLFLAEHRRIINKSINQSKNCRSTAKKLANQPLKIINEDITRKIK